MRKKTTTGMALRPATIARLQAECVSVSRYVQAVLDLEDLVLDGAVAVARRHQLGWEELQALAGSGIASGPMVDAARALVTAREAGRVVELGQPPEAT